MALDGHSSTVTTSGILVCGGYSSGYRTDCYEYRTSVNSWVRMSSMMIKRSSFGIIYLKGKVYAVGGTGGSGAENSMEIFDSTTRTWTQQSMPFDVTHHCITQLIGNKFILIGGGSDEVNKDDITKNNSIQQFHFLHFTTQNIFSSSHFYLLPRWLLQSI